MRICQYLERPAWASSAAPLSESWRPSNLFRRAKCAKPDRDMIAGACSLSMSVAISGQKWVASRRSKQATSPQNVRSNFHLCTHQTTPTLLLAVPIALLLGTNGPFAIQGTSGMHSRVHWDWQTLVLSKPLRFQHSTCLLVNARQADYFESAQGRHLPRRTASRCLGSLLPGTPRWPVHLFNLEDWACL